MGSYHLYDSWASCYARSNSDGNDKISCDHWRVVLDVPVAAFISMEASASDVENVVLQLPPNPSLSSQYREGNQGYQTSEFGAILSYVFNEWSDKAYRVADCETGYKLSGGHDPYELNRILVGSAEEVSLWQIHPIHFWKYDKDRLQSDIEYAAQAAWELSGYGTNWTGPWRICGWQ